MRKFCRPTRAPPNLVVSCSRGIPSSSVVRARDGVWFVMTDKRKRDEDAVDDAAAARNVALHYSGRDQQSTAQRQQSPIYHLRCLNNWVRARARREPSNAADDVHPTPASESTLPFSPRDLR